MPFLLLLETFARMESKEYARIQETQISRVEARQMHGSCQSREGSDWLNTEHAQSFKRWLHK
jgi:hypothetical protein